MRVQVYLDLRLLPLIYMALCDLEVDPLYPASRTKDLYPPQVRLKVVQN